MMRTLCILSCATLGLWPMTLAWADDGALPRGKTPAPGHKLTPRERPASADLKDCGEYIANPEAGDVYFSPDDKLMYFLSRQPGEIGPEGKAFLYELDLDTLKSKRIVSLRIADNAALIGHGNPLEAVTILDFRRARIGCGEGQTGGISIKWIGKQKIVKSYPHGNYKVVPSDQGTLIADMDQRNIKQLDLNTFQKRIMLSFNEKVYPLYVRTSPLQITGFIPEQNELVRWDGLETEPSAVLKLKKGMRLVQELDQFGIASSSEDGKVLQVKQIKGWSGEVFRGLDIRLPEGFHADRVGVTMDFRSGICLVQGANPVLRRELRQVLVYNGPKAQIERVFKAQEGQYFSQAIFGLKGRKILLLSRNLRDDSITAVRVGDVESGVWREATLSREMGRPSEKTASDKVPVDKAVPVVREAGGIKPNEPSSEKAGEKAEKTERSESKLPD